MNDQFDLWGSIGKHLRRLADRLDPPPARVLPAPVKPAPLAIPPAEAGVRLDAATKAARNHIHNTTATLERLGLTYRVRGGGTHFQLSTTEGWADFWPTTGKWWIAARQLRGHGLHSLLKALGVSA